MTDRHASPSLHVAAVTVRASGLTASSGSTLARSVALALSGNAATQHLAAAVGIGDITLRLPAAAVGTDGSVDAAAVDRALARWRAGADPEGDRHA